MSEIVHNQYSSWQAENSAKFIYNGFIYVGQVDTDPLIEANRVRVYYIDENEQEVNLTQPIRTNSSGFPVISETNSTVIQIRTDDDYSVKVLNKGKSKEWYIPKASTLNGVITIDNVSGLRDELNDRAIYLTLAEARAKTDLTSGQYVRVTDYDNGLYKVVSTSETGNLYLTGFTGGVKLELVPEYGYIDPVWYGADKTGSTLASGKIQEVLDWAEQQNVSGTTYKTTKYPVILGAGEFLSNPLIVRDGVHFLSDGNSTILKQNTTGDAIRAIADVDNDEFYFNVVIDGFYFCLLYTSPSPRDS